MARATVETAHPGPPLLRRGQQRRLADQADGHAAAGHRDEAAGLGLARPADGLGQRQVVGDGQRTAGELPGHQRGQPVMRARAEDSAALARRPQEERDHDRDHDVEDVGRGAEHALLQRAASPAPATATTRPPQAATTVPRSMLPVAPQTTDFSTRPPSSGRPGHQVEQADDQVGAGQPLDGHQQQAVRGHGPQRRARPRPRRARSSGPTTAIRNSCRGVRASPSIAVAPPRKCRVIDETVKPKCRAM